MIPPDRRFEVDEELWGLLDICSNDELEEIHKILYGEKLPSLVSRSCQHHCGMMSECLGIRFPPLAVDIKGDSWVKAILSIEKKI